MATIPVNTDNYERAETARMFDGLVSMAGGTNRWMHNRGPTPIDEQIVIRMNRDTLYSAAIVDISNGATLTMPDAAGRYMTAMIVNEDHYINRVMDEPGTYELTVDDYDTPFVMVSIRILVDPEDPSDIAVVNTLQDAIGLEIGSDKPYTHPEYDQKSLAATSDALRTLSEGLGSASHMFGAKEEVDPIRHLIGTAFGWGGLPESEAFYLTKAEPRPAGRFTFTVDDAPVDAFWSLSIYNRDGFFEANPSNAYSINNLTAVTDDDGSVTLNLGPKDDGLPNFLYTPEGWNYVLRLYKPREAVLDGSWTPPVPVQAS